MNDRIAMKLFMGIKTQQDEITAMETNLLLNSLSQSQVMNCTPKHLEYF